MAIKICPRCNQRYSTEDNVEDVIHECSSGNLTLDQEDVVVTGDWKDYNGSDSNIKPAEVNMQGAENRLQGRRAGIEGEDLENKTARGKRGSTRRQRQHLNFIKLREGGDCKWKN